MKKVYFLSFLTLLLSFTVQAEDYVLESDVELKNFSNGNKLDVRWTDEAAWFPSAPLVSGSGGTITIPFGVTLTLSQAFTFDGTIIVQNGGSIVFKRDQPNAGQLIMGEGSTINMEEGSSISSVGPAGNEHNYLEIGGFGINGEDINNLPAPPFALDENYTECIETTGSTEACNTILPVDLLYFNATAQTATVELNWASSKAWDFSHYELERSRNGQSFEYVATLDAEENSDYLTKFSYADRQPLNGTSYYRLKAVDSDGNFEYKGVVAVQFINTNFEVYPNPATQGVLKINNLSAGEQVQLVLRDHIGRTVRNLQLSGQQPEISTAGLPEGLYVLLIKANGHTAQRQVYIR